MKLKNAIVQEVNRSEIDVSKSEAERLSHALGNFFSFTGDVLLERVNESTLREYLRQRLRDSAARSTINRELCAVVRMMRKNGFIVVKPAVKQGHRTKRRPFSEGELKLFFTHCEEGHRILLLTMLMTGTRPAELTPSPRSKHIALLKEVMGHSKITTTEIYCQPQAPSLVMDMPDLGGRVVEERKSRLLRDGLNPIR